MRQGTACYVLALLCFGLTAGAASRPIPDPVEGGISLTKTALTISYNPEHKQPNWVFYELGEKQLRNCVQRGNAFQPDPALDERDSASLEDFKNSGFDRGHMSPAADNKWSRESMNDSFLLSNVSPQPPRFNQGIWGKLENLVRAWAQKKGGLWVTTGPVLESNLPTIGRGRVSTPHAYFKVLVAERTQEALAILIPVNASGDLRRYAVPISLVEENSRLNFHEGRSGEEEQHLEAGLSLDGWDFRATYKSKPCRGYALSSNLPGVFVDWQ